MGHEQSNIGQSIEIRQNQLRGKDAYSEDFVLERSIFNNVFEKDIRKVYIYKKAERLAKALHLVTPAFSESLSLKNRIDAIAIGLVDAAILPSSAARTALSRELLALSSILSIARTGGILSSMNADLIVREARILLQEVAAYEEPRLSLDDAPSLSVIAKNVTAQGALEKSGASKRLPQKRVSLRDKGHIKDTGQIKDRQEAILAVIKDKRKASIKDISTLIRGVSEKTVQRELATLVAAGTVLKEGERRWSTYQLAG